MGRKRKYPDMNLAGRPPKDPEEKIGRPVRALVTLPVMDVLEALMEKLGMNLSEVLRLALYNLLLKYDLLTDQLREDETFKSLREKGLL